MLKQLALASMVMTTAAIAEESPEVSLSGYFLSAMGGDLSDGPADYGAYNEIDLTTSVAFSKSTSVDIYTTVLSDYATSGDAWWPEVYFDGIMLTHNYTDDFSFYFGDLVYGAGDFGYYVYKRAYSIVDETAARGIGFSTAGLTFYTGMEGDNAWGNYVSYEAPMPEGMSFTAVGNYVGATGIQEIQAGAAFGMEADAFSVNATAGVFKATGSDVGFNVLLEPYMDFGMFNILGSFYMQNAGEKENTAMIAGGGLSDMYAYVEPGVVIDDIHSFGVTFEYHDADSDLEDETFDIWPTLYMAPAGDILFLITAGTSIDLVDSDADPSYGFGAELTGSF